MGADFTGVTMSGIKTPVLQWLRSCFSGKGFPWFVLICMLTVTTGLWQYTEITLINQSLDRFHSRVDKQKKTVSLTDCRITFRHCMLQPDFLPLTMMSPGPTGMTMSER